MRTSMMGRFICVLLSSLAFTPCKAHLLRKHGIAQQSSFATDAATCAPLTSKGTHFTVNIQVGTPGQTFSVVADTGSDSVIVPSCICKESGSCRTQDRCFQGTNKSSTFFLKGLNSEQLAHKQPLTLPVAQITFGSGPIAAVISTDVVNVGGTKATMKNGLLLMIQNRLKMMGEFEGILGLGQPKNMTEIKRLQKEQMKKQAVEKQKMQRQLAKMAKMSKASMDTGKVQPSGNMEEELKAIDNIIKAAITSGGGGISENTIATIARQHPAGLQALAKSSSTWISELLHPLFSDDHSASVPERHSGKATKFEDWTAQDPQKTEGRASVSEKLSDKGMKSQDPPKTEEKTAGEKFQVAGSDQSFLEAAGIDSFSLCFNEESQGGALHLAPPKAKDALISVGTMHWALNFEGVSIGDAAAPVKICSPSSKKEGQTAACGGIPDSGTTLLMGPAKDIQVLYEQICDGWERCRTAVSTGLGKVKAEVLQLLLSTCGDWLTEDKGLEEMPPLHFHVADRNGKKQALAIGGAGYILEQNMPETKVVTKEIMGMKVQGYEKTGNRTKVCAPAFSAFEMPTEKTGPAWILGQPFFYEYTVGYDLNKKDPAISFTKQTCGCSKETSLVSHNGHGGKRRPRQPRVLTGPPRVSKFDLSMGL